MRIVDFARKTKMLRVACQNAGIHISASRFLSGVKMLKNAFLGSSCKTGSVRSDLHCVSVSAVFVFNFSQISFVTLCGAAR